MNAVSACYPYYGDAFAGIDVTHVFKKRHDWGPDLVAADIYYPFFEVIAGEARDRAVILYAEKNNAAFQVGEGDQFLREILGLQVISLKLHAGILSVRDGLKQVAASRHASEPVLGAAHLESRLAAFEHFLDQFPHGRGID